MKSMIHGRIRGAGHTHHHDVLLEVVGSERFGVDFVENDTCNGLSLFVDLVSEVDGTLAIMAGENEQGTLTIEELVDRHMLLAGQLFFGQIQRKKMRGDAQDVRLPLIFGLRHLQLLLQSLFDEMKMFTVTHQRLRLDIADRVNESQLSPLVKELCVDNIALSLGNRVTHIVAHFNAVMRAIRGRVSR